MRLRIVVGVFRLPVAKLRILVCGPDRERENQKKISKLAEVIHELSPGWLSHYRTTTDQPFYWLNGAIVLGFPGSFRVFLDSLHEMAYHIPLALLFCLTCWAWRMVRVTDPGTIGLRPLEEYKAEYEAAVAEQIEAGTQAWAEDRAQHRRFCHTCMIVRPLRAKHCNELGKCVSRFDHHCPWVANTVGYENHKYFMVFAIAGKLTFGMGFIQGLRFFWRQYTVHDDWSLMGTVGEYPDTTLATLIGFFCWGMSTVQTFCNIRSNVGENVTTNELMNIRRYTHFKAFDDAKEADLEGGGDPDSLFHKRASPFDRG